MSEASEKQRRINDLLNASHNSQVERDYLRQRILEIFEEDEKALEEAEENNKKQSPRPLLRNRREIVIVFH